MYVRTYDFVATAVHPANNAIQTTVHQRIARRLIPTFQHAVFYNDDLEMLPGVTMTLAGRIHSNQDIYVDSKATLTIDTSYLYSAGDIFNRRKDTGLTDPGEVQIQVADTSPVQHQPMNGFDSNSPDWPTGDITRWNGTVKSAVNGVTKLTAPSVASIQPGDYYYTNAKTDGIIIQSDGTTTTIKKNNVALSCPSNTVTVTSSFKNNREGKNVTMVNINLAKLANLSGEKDPVTKKAYPNNLPSNGLLYATLTNSGSNEPGIRLVSGSQIERAAGLTVVSNQPVYIQGNYNTTSKKPASVIADSVNLLSAAWADDTNSTKSFASRQADPTTINCAFIAGIDTTASNQYNGGLENYPRLHEDWQGPGATLTIAGSFVELWNSAIAKGQWQYGTVGGKDYYTAPIRVWSYDSMFNDPTKLPPFTPWAVEAQRVAWW
jgi:hypothetical protein